MFKVAQTFNNPTQGANPQRGFPSPGAGDQTIGNPVLQIGNDGDYAPSRPTKGFFSWLFPSKPASEQRGYPGPYDPLQMRPPGSMPNKPPVFGGVYQKWTPYYDRGAAAYVPNFGKVLTNPIGAGVVANHRPQASYGNAGQYANGAIFWTNQVIPTSINLQGLTDPESLLAILSTLEVQAVVRTTG